MAVTFLQKSSGNSATTTLSSAVSDSDTSFPLTSDTAFLTGGGLVIIDEGETSEELAYYTGKSGGALTIPLANRGLEGGSSQGHSSGASVKGVLSADMWNNLIETVLNGFSATDGSVDTTKVVTPTGTQTLTNKTIDASSNTLTGVVTLTSTDTLTNKTLTSPKIGTSILDTNGNELALLTATGSAVNEITLANAATGNSPQISATGGDTNISLDLRGKGEGVTKGGIRYQSNTTNSNQNGVWIQSGWGFFVGDGDTSATEAVTFPTAFTTILSVVASGIGYKDSSDPSGIGDFADYGLYANVNSISTSGFTVSLNIPSGSIGATRRVGYSWIAIGI